MSEKQKNKFVATSENNTSFLQRGPLIPYIYEINLLWTGYEKCDPLHFAGPCYKHAHLLHIVLSGKGILRINNTEYTLARGDIFYINPDDHIYYQADAKDPWEYRWVKFSGASAQLLFDSGGISGRRVFRVRDEAQLHEFESWLSGLYDDLGQEYPPYLRATGRFYMFLAWFVSEFGVALARDNDRMSFMKIMQYINENFRTDINMEMIAHVTSYDRSHIYKLFMKNMGCSPKDYILNLRMSYACEMLTETTLSVKEISSRAGYNNYLSFIKYFKKRYNKLPTEYRDAVQAQLKGEKNA